MVYGESNGHVCFSLHYALLATDRRTSPSLICPTMWAGLKTNVMNEAITFFAVDIKKNGIDL